MKIKSKPILIFLGLLLIVWIIFANKIVLLLSDIPDISNYQYKEENSYSDAQWSIDSLDYTGGLFEMFQITGWIWSPGKQDIQQRSVSVILKHTSSSSCYELNMVKDLDSNSATMLFRNDVKVQYPELEDDRIVGFYGEFSTINLDDGIYEIYLNYKEAENIHGTVKTNRFVKKDGNSLQEVPFPYHSNPAEPKDYSQSEALNYCIDQIYIDNDFLNIKGWAYIENQNTLSQNVYIELQNKESSEIWTCYTLIRNDVAKELSDKSYSNSGFLASIPINDLHDKKCKFRIIIENNDTILCTEEILKDIE